MALKSIIKGFVGEQTVRFGCWAKLDSGVYRRLHNITLQTDNGTTQIDHVIVSRYGIFVIETKHYDGWIFGSEKDRQWTQTFGRKKFRFQNPLHQNYKHIKALSDATGIDKECFHSIVFFSGESTFKTEMPANVMNRGFTRYIKQFKTALFTDGEVDDIIERLSSERMARTLATRRKHIRSVKERYESTDTCPKCGQALVERTVRNGPRQGAKFLGCSGYPKCRFTREL